MSFITYLTLFDLDIGERFLWKERKYTLIGFDTDGDIAYVIEDGVEGQQHFDSFTKVQRCG